MAHAPVNLDATAPGSSGASIKHFLAFALGDRYYLGALLALALAPRLGQPSPLLPPYPG